MKKLLTLLGLTTALIVGTAQADTLLTWDLAGQASAATLTADTIATNLDTSSGLNELSRTGVVQSTTSQTFGSNTWNLTDTFDEADKFISFTLQASSGYQATFESIAYVINGSNTAPQNGRWGYRVGSGSFNLQDPFTITFAMPGALVSWDFSDFTTTDSVEFRFWAWGTTSINGGTSAVAGALRTPGNIAGDDLVLNGSVALVPEPSSLALISLGALGMAGYMVRRRSRK